MSERHLESDISLIRADHVYRYEYAKTLISGIVFDGACGCGYGSHILAGSDNVGAVYGLDIDQGCIDFAKEHWKHDKVHYSTCDVSKNPIGLCDWFVSFETIEHIEDPVPFLKGVASSSKNLICSVPNQDVIPFKKSGYPFHFKHYTPHEIQELLKQCGFKVEKIKYQAKKTSTSLNKDTGRTIIIIAKSLIYND